MNEDRHGFFDQEMEYLKQFIGKEVNIVYITPTDKKNRSENKPNGEKGILQEIIPYESVTINNKVLTFLGPNSTILGISYGNPLKINESELYYELYLNKRIPQESFLKSYPFYEKDFFRLISEQREYLGYSVREEEISSQMKR